MKKKVLSLVIALGALILVGCGEKPKNENVAGNKTDIEFNELQEQDEKKEEANIEEKKEDKKEESKVEQEKPQKEEEKINLLEEKITKGEFKLYKPNDQIDGIAINTSVKTENKTISENLNKIILELENNNFLGCKVIVKELKEINGRKILSVDLKDSQKSWYRDYLQGSTGGYITESILINSFLQPDGTKLVDGIKFTVNGKQEAEFNHAPKLSQTTFR